MKEKFNIKLSQHIKEVLTELGEQPLPFLVILKMMKKQELNL